jgi:hypothetical protein
VILKSIFGLKAACIKAFRGVAGQTGLLVKYPQIGNMNVSGSLLDTRKALAVVAKMTH